MYVYRLFFKHVFSYIENKSEKLKRIDLKKHLFI